MTEKAKELGITNWSFSTANYDLVVKWINEGAPDNKCNPGCDTTKFTFAAVIWPIFSQACGTSTCHTTALSTPGQPDLSSFAAIDAEIKNNPGRLLASIEQIAPYNGPATAMPQGSAKLDTCYIKLIKKWIDAGHLNN